MSKQYTVNFYNGDLKFSAGHFTIFSATERERLHGHNYHLAVSMTAIEKEPGITFDYRIFQDKLVALCQQLNAYFLLPEKSPYLKITEENDYVYTEFNGKKIPFLKEDVRILPITNTTLEALSAWFLQQILVDEIFLEEHKISQFTIKVFNGKVHSAESQWTNEVKP